MKSLYGRQSDANIYVTLPRVESNLPLIQKASLISHREYMLVEGLAYLHTLHII